MCVPCESGPQVRNEGRDRIDVAVQDPTYQDRKGSVHER
jgi:hypothetical protein